MLFVFIFLDDYFFILVLVHLLHCLKIVCLHLVCTMIVSSLLTSPQWDQLLSKEQLLLYVCVSLYLLPRQSAPLPTATARVPLQVLSQDFVAFEDETSINLPRSK